MTIKLVGSSSGSVALDAPASTTSGANIEFKLPVADGSANQVIKTDGSGNLGFITNVSSGFVKLYEASTTGGTAVSSFSVDGYFDDSKYSHYKVIISDHFTAASSGSNQPSLRFNVGGSAVTTASYYWSLTAAYGASSGQFRGTGASNTTGDTSIAQMQGTWEVDHYNYQLQNYEMTFFSPTTAKADDGTGDGAKYITWTSSMLAEGQGTTSYPVSGIGGACMKTNSPLTGFTMYSHNSTTFTYKVSLYGFAK